MNVKLISHTKDPEKVIAIAARTCYSSDPIDTIGEKLTDEAVVKMINMLSEVGHESPIEHASFTFSIEGVSRSLLAQITRHRIASFSVRSQRYINETNFSNTIPEEIQKNPMALLEYEQTMEHINNSYNKITQLLSSEYEAEGMDRMPSLRKASENARAVLPNSCNTAMIVTMNARSLNNFFDHRMCNRAQEEIRELANRMYDLVAEVAPNLFRYSGAPCMYGKCPEGKMSCGKPLSKRV